MLYTKEKYLSQQYSVALPLVALILILIYFMSRMFVALFTHHFWYWFLISFLYLVSYYAFATILFQKLEVNNFSYGRGYKAEEMAAAILSTIGDEYKVIHSLPRSYGDDGGRMKFCDTDHIVVGPSGVFAIETKANNSLMIWDTFGKKEVTELANQFAKQARRHAYWLNKELNKKGVRQFVQGVVFRPFNSNGFVITKTPGYVRIIDGDAIIGFIKNNKRCLSKYEVDTIYAHLCEIKRSTNAERKKNMSLIN